MINLALTLQSNNVSRMTRLTVWFLSINMFSCSFLCAIVNSGKSATFIYYQDYCCQVIKNGNYRKRKFHYLVIAQCSMHIHDLPCIGLHCSIAKQNASVYQLLCKNILIFYTHHLHSGCTKKYAVQFFCFAKLLSQNHSLTDHSDSASVLLVIEFNT